MRQRLWYTISLLDLQSSFDQAPEPLITTDLPQPNLPRNVNDSEFDPAFEGDLPDREGLTDMTFALITYSAQASGRALNFVPAGDMAKGSTSAICDWDARQYHVDLFEQQALQLLRHCDPNTSTYTWFTFHGTGALIASMKLAALRPLHRAGYSAPPRVQGNPNLLKVSARVLEKAHLICTDSRGGGFGWYIFIQWHALAIAVSECYVCSDVELVRHVWPLIEASFEQHSRFLADYRQGILRRPLEKLMRQTRSKVSMLLPSISQPVSMSAIDVDSRRREFDTTTTSRSDAPGANMAAPSHMPVLPQQMSTSVDSTMTGANQPVAATTADLSQTLYPFYGLGSVLPADGTSQTISDPAWGSWEDFVNDLFLDESGSMNDLDFGSTTWL